MVNLKRFLKRGILLFIFALTLSNCKDDDNFIEAQRIEHEHFSTNKRVNGNEIPHVLDFISNQTNGTFSYTLKGKAGTREPDLTIGNVVSQSIIVTTNQSDLSNYSFKMDKADPDGEESWLNLVVKETTFGMYSYIMKYRPSIDWMTDQDWSSFSGDIVFYLDDGTYVSRQGFENGTITSREVIDPCDDNNTNNGDGGGGGDDGTTGDGPGGGTGGGSGNTCSITIIEVVCPCQGHGVGDSCSCTVQPYLEINFFCPDQKGNLNDVLRSSGDCAGCYNPVGDPCPCAIDGISCADDSDHGDVGVNLPQTECDWLNERMNQQDFTEKIEIMNDASQVTPPENRFENGFVMTGLGVNTQYIPYSSLPNTPQLPNAQIPENTTGLIHNHFFINETINNIPYKSVSIFSAGDFLALYLATKNGDISNTLNFTYAVIYQGHMFNLHINNLQALIDFGDNWLQPSPDGKPSKIIADEMLRPSLSNIRHENSTLVNRDNMARMLKKFADAGLDMGLDLYYSPIANPNWQKVVVNNDNSVSLEDCN